MGLQQNVWHADAVAQGGFLPGMMRILIAADIEPRPAVEGAFAHPSYKIGHKVVAKAVALVDRAPELAGPGSMAVIVRRSSGSTDLSGSFSHWFGPHLSVPAGARRSSVIVVVVRFQKRKRSAASVTDEAENNSIAAASGRAVITDHANEGMSSGNRGGVAECWR
jgi:hypothetical protein